MWYDYLIYFVIFVGILHLAWGLLEHKKFAWGLILIISALIVKMFIWILTIGKN